MIYKHIGSKLNINKEDFYNEIKKSKEQDCLTKKAVDYFIKMAVHGVRHGNLHYPDYRDEEDCIQAALYDMLKHWKNFDENLYTDPFSFFSSFVFNGYANQFKMIHKHRFVKSSKLYRVDFDCEFDIENITKELNNVYMSILDEVKEKDIKKVQIRFKGSRFCKWKQIKMGDTSFLHELEKDFTYVKFMEVKFDYINGVEFIKLDQTDDDSEIFNI